MSTHVPEEHVPSEETPSSGGGHSVYPTEEIHATGGGITGTAARIREISQNVGNLSIDEKSFGALNVGFAATAQTHVRTAQQHVETTSTEVDAAATATHSTADNFQRTEDTNTKRYTDIDPPAGKRQNAEPAAPTSNGSGPPPNGPTSPSGPSGPGGPPSRPPDLPPPRESWRESIQKNFTPEEQAQLNDAFHKMSEPPRPGEVAGAGQLTPEQRQLMMRAQRLVTIDPDTPMQKVLQPGVAKSYLDNRSFSKKAGDPFDFDPTKVSGFAARQQDVTAPDTPAAMIQANRLDYPGSPFKPDEPVYVMKFPAVDKKLYQMPVGAPFGDLDEHDPHVQGTADDMMHQADLAGLNRNTYERQVNPWPYSGIGVTADEQWGVPERIAKDVGVADGSEIWEYSPTGSPELVARFNIVTDKWESLRP